ncbi:MAG: MBOAT family O-acyltransferase [Eubacteriales bacterium]|nr:MBOAT family O-acyltransferase [Eubacteriales bacterium]
MSFLSVKFLLFLAVLFAAYFLLPKKWQRGVLLIANIVFYLSAGVKYAGFILVTAISAWGIALLVERTNEKYQELRKNARTREEKQAGKAVCTRKKKQIMIVVMALNFGIWIGFKYSGLPLPLGISFYTFIAVGYCIDVYRGKYTAEKRFDRFFLFLTFFPHIIQGPFSRYDKLKDSLSTEHEFSLDRMGEGIVRMLWGFFKKMVIADRLGVVVQNIYGGEGSYGGIYILVLMAAVTLQLYADFSGYMDIAAGICRVLGLELQENFRQPLFSRSIEEVWRRWHITLGAWFRDYLFYSISMSRAVQKLGKRCKEKMSPAMARMIPSYLALAVVWTATGFWHGATWYYLIWGWMNMVFIILGMQLSASYTKIREKLHISDSNRAWRLFQMLRTFLLFGYMEMFSDSGSTSCSVRLTISLFSSNNWGLVKHPLLLFPGLEILDVVIVAAGLLLILTADILKEKGKNLYQVLKSVPIVVRYIGYAGLFYAIILLGNTGTDLTGGFMYAQF